MVDELNVVVGLGVTGLSVVKYLLAQGCSVAVTDSRENPPNAQDLPEHVKTYFGALNEEVLLSAKQIIISPGLSLETPAIAKAIKAGVSIVGDVHLLAQAIQQMPNPIPFIAITGSNAKSTVTTLVANMAEKAGIKVAAGGNLGKPALELLENQPEMVVLEVSSFQLESTTNLSATVATVLNMSEDHLDRHHTMAEYQHIKHKIFQNVKNIVVNADDAMTKPTQSPANSQVSFGLSAPTEQNFGLIEEDGIVWIAKGIQKLVASHDLKIKGQHNLLNAQAALALGDFAGINMDAMLDALKDFKGLPHRCEFVKTVNQVDYFNDSKGTNIGSTLAAINGLGSSYHSVDDNKKLYLILGGEGKGQDFTQLQKAVGTYVKQVVLIGRDAPIIKDALENTQVSMVEVNTLENAVSHISEHSQSGDLALLSPACASFDQFKSYVARGEAFISLIDAL